MCASNDIVYLQLKSVYLRVCVFEQYFELPAVCTETIIYHIIACSIFDHDGDGFRWLVFRWYHNTLSDALNMDLALNSRISFRGLYFNEFGLDNDLYSCLYVHVDFILIFSLYSSVEWRLFASVKVPK